MTAIEEELDFVTRLAKGDGKVIHNLYERHLGYLIAYVVKNQGSEEEAKDLWQETLIMVIANIRSGAYKNQNIHGYIRTVFINQWKKILRSKKQMTVLAGVEEYPKEEPPEETWGDLVWEELLMWEVGKKFYQLKEECQRILNLRYVDKKSHEEIGKIIHIERSSSKTKLSRCLKTLKNLCHNDPNFPPKGKQP
ncbi:MAG: sigma-70 family RNA polymerase sigma factor [Bacteroidota bacterium]